MWKEYKQRIIFRGKRQFDFLRKIILCSRLFVSQCLIEVPSIDMGFIFNIYI